ncbi:MAG TPA: CoA transferase [Verrucomicrobiae bacterium]|jgi:crotonobetainyl-CoA:carnitine CoA-transferase CaiB-like acyl-CoA transferase|nr:CoA transferase [Verrucomicrobiae bacterium]
MQSLKGIKVVEFAAFAAGPVVGKHLADHGATVVHIESQVRPDGFRGHYPPYKDNIHGLNRSGLFALCNNDKLDITLNLKKAPAATELAKRIAAWADIVIENFSPGTMDRLGLGYEALKQVKPDLIMLSSSNLGQSGPHAHHAGFGSQLSSLAGFTHLTGYAGGSPQILYGPYIDYIAVAYGAVAILAALDYRKRTGEGNYIDTAQYETGLQYLAPILLDYKVNGRVAERNANRNPHAAPHGAYPCKGDDRWCAISVSSDDEWQTLVGAMKNPAWAKDFASFEARKRNEDELDRLVGKWTIQFEPRELMERLQKAGVKAGVVNRMCDVYDDPQLKLRPQWVPIEHPEIGKMHYQRPPFLLTKTPPGPAKRDPLLAEHNEYFYCELLGLGEEEYKKLVDEQVIY